MRKIILFLSIVLFMAAAVLAVPGGDRNRFYLLGGLGYASSHPAGIQVETGVEVRLFGKVHARILLDHYFGDNTQRESEILKHMNGISLFAVYKVPVTETVDFRLKLGGHYANIRSRITALGLTFNTTKADIGFCGGAGFSFQLSNIFYLYAEATVKHLLLDQPWTWLKANVGVMYRFR